MNSKQLPFIIIIVILLVVIGGLYYHYTQKIALLSSTQSKPAEINHRPGGMGSPGGMVMIKASPPPVSEQQTQQLALGLSTTTKQKTFNITGSNFYFVPNKITVNEGDQVTFVMTNAGGMHDLVIDEFNVKTPITKTGEAATVTFTASKKGSFVYYCSVPGHRQKGMWGTLVVQ